MGLAVTVFFVVGAGACLQRVAGMGLGLIAATILSIVIGPVEGVLIVNVLAVITAVFTTLAQRGNIDWWRFWRIAPVLVFGSVPAALLIRQTNPAMLQVLVGALLLIALTVVTWGNRYVPRVQGTVPAVITGVLAGFMNTLAGIAGPAITVYAQASRWDHFKFTATLQPIFIVTGLVSLITKVALGAGSVAQTPVAVWVGGVLGLGCGLILGAKIAGIVPRQRARMLALTVATLGGVSALIHGALGLL